MKPYLWHPKLVIKLIVMPCDKRKPGNAKIRVLKARNVSKNGVKIKRSALLHRDITSYRDAKRKSECGLSVVEMLYSGFDVIPDV